MSETLMPFLSQPYTLHENSPIVSMDVSLGKKYSYVNFDYAQFEAESARLELPLNAQANLTIHINKNKPLVAHGCYKDSRIELREKGQVKTNEILVHEMQHASDDVKGVLKRDFRFAASKLIPLTMYGASTWNGISFANAVEPSNFTDSLATVSLNQIAITGGFAALQTWAYLRHPMERRAQQAAKDSTANVITLTPKTRS